MKKVTKEQIQELYQFTRQHYVEHYDVQTELVDHLANDIEAIWQEHPNLSFYEARDKSFQKFGVFGFMDMYGARQKALGKKYNKLLWKYAKEWFKIPKILITLTMFLGFYTIFTTTYGKYYFITILLLLCVYEVTKGIKLLKIQKIKVKNTGKKWLLEDLIFKIASLNGLLLASNSFSILGNISSKSLSGNEQSSLSPYAALFFSAIIIAGIIYAYISLNILPSKAEELLNEQYPEYQLENN